MKLVILKTNIVVFLILVFNHFLVFFQFFKDKVLLGQLFASKASLGRVRETV